MDDTNLYLTVDLGANTLRDLTRLNTSVAIDVGPNISKSVKYLVYGIVGCTVLQCITQLLLANISSRKPPSNDNKK
ncbi:hypothetical protein BC943DRAFT_315627 [Umbelopsis sp. AD052]|nr:hypothetical protein BC943DRAFT_315627 [Umbelopsis sp. AD052]